MSTHSNAITKSFAPPAMLTEIRTMALFAGLVGAVALVIGAFLNFEEFLRGYLIAYIFVLGLSLGSLALLMTGHLTGGNWWMLSRRSFEAAARCLPMLAVLFLPILLGAKHLYTWMSIDPKTDKVLSEKAWWLNQPGWTIRALIYFVVWIALTLLLTGLSTRQDEDPSPGIWKTMKAISGVGIVLWGLTLTFAT